MAQHRVRGQEAGLHVPPTSPRGRYLYRGKSTQTLDTPEPTQPTLQISLLDYRQKLSQAAARLRAVTARRNQQIADALTDGIPPAALAAAAGTTPTAVRAIGLSFEDVFPHGMHRQAHLAALLSTAEEMQTAEADKTELERQRDQLIATAHRLRICDEYQIAALTGLTAPEIKRMVRGTRTRPRRL